MKTSAVRPAAEITNFSIIIETENLAKAGLDSLRHCLDSLIAQDLPASEASEVVVIDSGQAPATILTVLESEYPWVTVYPVGEGASYYEAKALGLTRTTGELILFCDSDCVYAEDWIRLMLNELARPGIEVVAGETTLQINDSFSLGVALIWGFPTFDRRVRPYPTAFYPFNNVGFRRTTLERVPVPVNLDVYRGVCQLHSEDLRAAGVTIWKLNAACNIHPLPMLGAREFLCRMLVMGRDWRTWIDRSAASKSGPAWLRRLTGAAGCAIRWVIRPIVKLPRAIRDEPRRLRYVPVALLVVAAALALFFAGYVFPKRLTRIAPRHMQEKPVGT